MRQFWMSAAMAAVMLLGVTVAARAQESGEYRLGAGDAIKIMVYQHPDLTLETRVTESGTISYPLIGSVNIGGQTLEGAEKAIGAALSKGDFVRQPQVTVSLVQTHSNQVAVLGRTNRPGRYALETSTMRLTDVLAMAGGASDDGADIAVVTGVRAGKPFRKEIDVAALFAEGASESEVQVTGGDTIYVHRAPMFYIYGEVQRPGAYRVERGMTVMQGLAQGGGPTLRGSERSLRLYRRDKQNALQQVAPVKDAPLQADDVLHVPEGWF
ncbi:MAG TPA: polysaccharide export protein EpsE [Burkholderiales bacterium]|nr:polysaccharide export protein EpsE [Burkholderiales bacterium]